MESPGKIRKICSECDSVPQETTGMTEKRATFEDIVGWIQNKLELYGNYVAIRITVESKIKHFDGTVIELAQTNHSFVGNSTYEKSNLYTIDCSKLTSSVEIIHYKSTLDTPELSYLILCSMPNQKAITRVSSHEAIVDHYDSETETTRDTNPIPQASIRLGITEKDVAERMAKAFHDAIELCGGKPELY